MSEEQGRGIQAAAAAGGAFLGLAVGNPVLGGLVGAAAGPALIPFVQRIWDEISGDAQLRGAQLLADTAAAHGADPEQTAADLLDSSEGVRLLTALAVNAAAGTTNRDKIRALGRSLAHCLADDAVVDEEHLIIKALGDLEQPHISVLQLLRTRQAYRTWGAFQVQDNDGHRRSWKALDIADALPGARGVLTSLLGTLERHGLVRHEDNLSDVLAEYAKADQEQQRRNALSGTSGRGWPISSSSLTAADRQDTWRITDLGVLVLDYLADAAADTQQPRTSED